MKKKPFRKTVLWIIAVIALSTTTLFLLPDYARRAFIYLHADIDDYLIFPYNTVKAGDYQPWSTIKDIDQPALSDSIMEEILSYDPVAFLVIHNDKMIYEQYFNGHTDTSISNTFSVTKGVVSFLTSCAVEDGYIGSLDDKVSSYLSEFSGKLHGEELTVLHLLKMSSGLNYNEAYSSPFSPTTRSYYGKDLARQMLSLDFKEKPGVNFEYISANTQILGMILQKATGMSIAEYASEKLWQPLGAKKDALWSKDREDGMEKTFCCFTATASDLARLGKLVCDSGVWNGNQIITPEYFRLMTQPSSDIKNKDNPLDAYGLHFWLTKWDGHDVIYARGIKGQYIIAVPSKKLVIVRLGHKRSKQYINDHPVDLFLYLKAGFELAR